MIKLLIFWIEKKEFAMESALTPLEICSKIGIFSMLLLSLFADRENTQIFFSFKGKDMVRFILLSI